MRIIDNYILKSIIIIFLTTLAIFSFLYIVIDITSNLDEIIDRKIPIDILIQYYLSFLPIMLVQTSSVCCLIATLFTYSQLNNNNEIIALRTSGMNFRRIAKPAICFGLIISAVVFWLNEKYVPQANARSEEIRAENFMLKVDRERKKKQKIKNLTFYGLKNRLYFIDRFDPHTYELEGITIIGYDQEQNIREKIVALRGIWVEPVWKFFQCHITEFHNNDDNSPLQIKVYGEKLMDIKESPEDFLQQRLNVTSMNIRQLHDYIRRFSNSGATKALNNLRVDLYQKMAFPIGNLVIILVGLPFALMTARRKAVTFTSLGIAIGIGFLYYVFNAVGIALGKGGFFPPLLAAWFAPGLFTGIAVILVKWKF